MGREGFELSTFRLSAERSNHAELPALWAHESLDYASFIKEFLERSLKGHKSTEFAWLRKSLMTHEAILIWARCLVRIKALNRLSLDDA